VDTIINFDEERDFLSRPEILQHHELLNKLGVLTHINSLEEDIMNFKNLFASTIDIYSRNTVEDLIDATVRRIYDNSLPSIISFLLKPLQNREELIIRSYRDNQLVDVDLNVQSINSFESFFQKYPRPVNYELFAFQIGVNNVLKSFDTIEPELVVPIMGPSGLYGIVLMGKKIQRQEYSLRELSFMQQLLSFVSLAIQNHLHYERTLRDVKTGLYNNIFFLARLNEEAARTKRSELQSSIIMIDIDHFKRFNDTYGHLAGDKVLESLAITIKQTLRTEDIPSRFGGEEFSVLLPGSGKEQAFFAAERLRKAVADLQVPWDPPLPQITISLGVFTFGKKLEISAEEIVSRADEALYLSKGLGRNRTTAWGCGLLDKIERRYSRTKLDVTPTQS